MRTKTLALSTLLGALGSATSLLAQVNVYSINAVGYINVSLPPGYSILTCPLVCTPNNTISTLFPTPAVVPPGGAPNQGAEVLVFPFGAADTISYSGGWLGGGTITVNPGQAVFFLNPNTIGTGANMTTTFVGTVPQNGQYNMTNGPLVPGYNLVGSIVPVTGSFISPIIDMTNSIGAGDYVLYFDPSYNPSTHGQNGFEAAITGSYSLGWLGGPGAHSEPVSTNVVQGFYYYNSTAAIAGKPGESIIGTVSASNEFWVENFTINP